MLRNDTLTQQTQEVIAFARNRHQGQKRDDGSDYFENHVKRVIDVTRFHYSCFAKDFSNSHLQLLVQTAALHDVIEDTSTTVEELSSLVSNQVIEAVKQLTRVREAGITREQHFENLLKHVGTYDELACVVKIFDRSKNVQDVPNNGWDLKRQSRYLRENLQLYSFLFDRAGQLDIEYLSRAKDYIYPGTVEKYLQVNKSLGIYY